MEVSGYDAVPSSFDFNLSTQQQQQQQTTNDASIPAMPTAVDPATQYFDFDNSTGTVNNVTDVNMCMPDPTAVLYAGGGAANDHNVAEIVNFQFDAQFQS